MIRNIAEVHRGHAKVIEQTERLFGDGMEFAGEAAEAHVHSHPEFKPRTGALQDATKHKIVRTRGGKLLKIVNDKKYAAAIDTGARPHIIVPRRAQFLRFRAKSGQIVFARRVRHPGNKPYKFMYFATDAAYRLLGKFLRDGMTRVAGRF